MRFEETAITTIKNVDFGESELRVTEHILLAIFLTNSLGPTKIISTVISLKGKQTYMRGARCAEYSQWKISNVLGVNAPEVNNSLVNSSFSQKFNAPSM